MNEDRAAYETLTANAGSGPPPAIDLRPINELVHNLRNDIDRLTAERNAALRRNDELEALCNELAKALNAMREQRDRLTELRDDLRQQLAAVTAERDEALAALRDTVRFILYLGHEPSELAADVLARHEMEDECAASS